MYCSDVPSGADVMKGCFVLGLNAADTDRPAPNYRLVVHFFSDQEKGVLIDASSTVRAASIRLLVVLASTLRMRLLEFDVTESYLQNDTEMGREVYLEASKELGLDGDKLLHVLTTLYELTDSGDYSHRTVRSVFIDKHGMCPSPSDPSF